ncbi:MAG: hypothetical protein AAGA31_08635 [Bacteroidota bacterium]
MTDQEIRDDFAYLFSKINWGASNLDAKAIRIMNELPANIFQELQETRAKLVDANQQVDGCRHYLMGVPADKITVEDTLVALGLGPNGLST